MITLRSALTLPLIVFTLALCSVPIHAQKGGVPATKGSNPLGPNLIDYPRIGLEIGLSSVWQSGSYQAGCGDFKEGARINPLIALAYDHPLSSSLRFEMLAGFQARGVSSSYNSRENVLLNTNNGFVRTDVDFENLGDFNAGYLFVLPSVKLFVTRGLYVGAGLDAAFMTGASAQYTKNILSRTIDINELGLSEVYYPEGESSDPYSKVYPQEDRSDASGFALDAAFYAGVEFAVNAKVKIGPRLLYSLPLTSVLNNPDLKLNTFQFLIGGRYILE